MLVQPGSDGLRVRGRLDPHPLRPDGDDDPRAGRGPCVGVGDHPREAQPGVGLDHAPPGGGIVLEQGPLDRVRGADEVGHEAVDRPLVELGRQALLLDAPVLHDDDDVAHGQGLLLVVGHVHERDPDLLLEGLELELHLLAQLEVQRAQRLVEEQHGGVVDQRPGQRDALLLAARELPGPALLVAGQAHELEGLAHAPRLVGLGGALPLPQAVAHVLGHVHVREQGVMLEHGVHVAVVGRHPRDRLAREVDLARGGLLEPRDHAQGRGLAAAGGSQEGVEGAPLDREVHRVDRGHIAEPLGDARDPDVGDAGCRMRLGERRFRHGRRGQTWVLGSGPGGGDGRTPRPVGGWYEASRFASTRDLARHHARSAPRVSLEREIRGIGQGRRDARRRPRPSARVAPSAPGRLPRPWCAGSRSPPPTMPGCTS